MLLGIDIGTTNTKVGIYTKSGELLSHQQATTPRVVMADGFESFPPEELWQTVAGLIKKAVQASDVKIEGLAIASMGESGVPLDINGDACYPIIPWNDGRSESQLDVLTNRLEPTQWFSITGLYPNSIHSIAKWLFIRDTEARIWQKTKQWLSVSNYIDYRLTGNAVMEASQAARTMAFDVSKNIWSDEILKKFDFSNNLLAPVISATSLIGHVTTEAAKLTGLEKGTAVYAGGHDHICAAFACGALKPDICLDSQGTAEGLVFGVAGTPNPAKAGGFGLGPHVIAEHSYLLSGIYSAGSAMKWVKDLLNISSYESLETLAEQVPPGESPIFIANFLGAAPPFNHPNTKAAFLLLTPKHCNAHFVRAVYEGIAMEIRRGIEAFEALTNEAIVTVRMVGGSAINPLWGKIRASILGRPLELAPHDDMVTAGAALLAGLGAGIYKNPQEAIQSSYFARQVFYPNPEWQIIYKKRYQEYKLLAEMLAARRRK